MSVLTPVACSEIPAGCCLEEPALCQTSNKMVCGSSFYGVEETPILGFLSSSKCWGDRKSIPLSEQTLSPSPSLPREDTVNGKMQTRMDKKDP